MTNWFENETANADESQAEQAVARQGQLTKPPGSLGRLEEAAVRLCALQARPEPAVDHVEIVVFAGDHGVVDEGISAFPQVVTGEMVRNFVRGGAAISVLADQLGAGLTVVNMGLVSVDAFGDPVVDRPVGPGTRNFAVEPAMSRDQCFQAMSAGKEIVYQFTAQVELLVGGEMGIGNTTAAAALACALGAGSADELAGPGTGLDSAGVSHKCRIIEKALARMGERGDPVEVLAELGGYEIAALTGFYIAAAQRGIPCLVDGFITSVAALVANRINPGCREWQLFSHASAEPGHARVMTALSAQPLLDLGMRLGEGSGAGIAVNILRSGCGLHNRMATFEEASVSDGS